MYMYVILSVDHVLSCDPLVDDHIHHSLMTLTASVMTLIASVASCDDHVIIILNHVTPADHLADQLHWSRERAGEGHGSLDGHPLHWPPLTPHLLPRLQGVLYVHVSSLTSALPAA